MRKIFLWINEVHIAHLQASIYLQSMKTKGAAYKLTWMPVITAKHHITEDVNATM